MAVQKHNEPRHSPHDICYLTRGISPLLLKGLDFFEQRQKDAWGEEESEREDDAQEMRFDSNEYRQGYLLPIWDCGNTRIATTTNERSMNNEGGMELELGNLESE